MFVGFFFDQCVEGYKKDCDSYRGDSTVSSKARSNLKNKYYQTKIVVRAMLSFLENFPPPRPQSTSVEELRQWKNSLEVLANSAYSRVLAELKQKSPLFCSKKKKNPIVSATTVRDDPIAKSWAEPGHSNFRSLPGDTPLLMKSLFLDGKEKDACRKRKRNDTVESECSSDEETPAADQAHQVAHAVPV